MCNCAAVKTSKGLVAWFLGYGAKCITDTERNCMRKRRYVVAVNFNVSVYYLSRKIDLYLIDLPVSSSIFIVTQPGFIIQYDTVEVYTL